MIKKYKIFLLFFLLVSSVTAKESQIKVQFGIDVLIENNFQDIEGLRVAMLTNFAGRTSNGELSCDVINNSKKCKLKMILVPEHGFFTTIPAGEHVADSIYKNIPLISLYGKNREPIPSLLKDIDVIVIDIQDVGVRSYTFLSTVINTMKIAAENKIKVIILDRPNPLSGSIIDGNTTETNKLSFVSIIPIPYIHGCTLGELALIANGENWLKSKSNLKCNLQVIKMKNWTRDMFWEDTGLNWYPTSPHIPSVNSIKGMATFGVFGEIGCTSLGIGTTLPFQIIGYKSFNSDIFNLLRLESIKLNYLTFHPFYGKYKNENVNGFFAVFNLNSDSKPFQEGIKIFLQVKKKYPELFISENIKPEQLNMFIKVTGTEKIKDVFYNNANTDSLFDIINNDILNFTILRNNYLLY